MSGRAREGLDERGGRAVRVREILAVKGNALFTVPPQARLREAVATMVSEDIGSLVVVRRGEVVGLLTFREVLRAVAEGGAAWEGIAVERVMVCPPRVVDPEMPVEVLRAEMVACHQRYFPVVTDGVLLGVISFHDVARAILEEQGFENRALKAFLQGLQERGSEGEGERGMQ
ncbi:MAG: CBS domain-containing protein [Hydrogenophilus sp.]|nr:CBS domain-containing protein [Hydrogenophilus sp.]